MASEGLAWGCQSVHGQADRVPAACCEQVPAGHVWLQGDNTLNSTDSRHYGPVPYALLKGRAFCKARDFCILHCAGNCASLRCIKRGGGVYHAEGANMCKPCSCTAEGSSPLRAEHMFTAAACLLVLLAS
jgi:Signal peptidase, peptidase S26